MTANMQQRHSTEKSSMALTELPATDVPGNDTEKGITLQDENAFTLATLNKSVADGQDDDVSIPHIHVDAQTEFNTAAALQQRRKIYIAGVGSVLVTAVIAMQVLYFTHLALSSDGGASLTKITLPTSAGIAGQISAAADSRDDKTILLNPVASPVTTGKVYIDNIVKDTANSDQTDDEKSGQREKGPSILSGETLPAEMPPGTRSELSTPIAPTAPVVTPDTDIAEIIGYDREGGIEEIRIIRNRTPDRTGELINSAYAAFVAGNYSDARQAYLGVLKDMPDHHDALLGMAAIAQRTGEPDQAGRFWMQVLADHPDDPVATAALITLMADQDYTGATRSIGKLLQDYPHAAFLYFSLGNLHASASRWPEAQQAFAEAARLEGDNPDYAYNLAVSLEHVGDHSSARSYYKTALELAHDKPVNFDSSMVMTRITGLSETTHDR